MYFSLCGLEWVRCLDDLETIAHVHFWQSQLV